MEKQFTKISRLFLLIVAAAGWFALSAQFILLIQNHATSIPETIVRYFSYFTILTNLLVAVCVSVLLLSTSSKWKNFFSHSSTLTAITVYIFVVGLVYNLILRAAWEPEGLQKFVDELLHSIIPILFLLYWFLLTSKSGLKWKNVFAWLIYPLVYIILILIRGGLAGFYPYPFINVNELGYGKVISNCMLLTFLFSSLSLLFIWIGKLQNEK